MACTAAVDASEAYGVVVRVKTEEKRGDRPSALGGAKPIHRLSLSTPPLDSTTHFTQPTLHIPTPASVIFKAHTLYLHRPLGESPSAASQLGSTAL